MRPALRIAAFCLSLALPAPLAAEAPPLTDDEIRVSKAATIETYGDQCGDIIGPLTQAMRRTARKAERDFVDANGQPAWDAAMAEARIRVDNTVQVNSRYYYCAYVHEGFVLFDGIDGGLKRPSFRCSGSLSAGQRAICDGGPAAWGYDRALARIIADLQPMLNDKGKALVASILSESEPFLEACLTGDADCAARVLERRMQRLADVYVKVGEALKTSP